MKNCLFSVIGLVYVKTPKLTKHCRERKILGVRFIHVDIDVDIVLSTYVICTESIYKVHYGLKVLPTGTLNYICQTSKKTEYLEEELTFKAYLLNILQQLLFMHQLQN